MNIQIIQQGKNKAEIFGDEDLGYLITEMTKPFRQEVAKPGDEEERTKPVLDKWWGPVGVQNG